MNKLKRLVLLSMLSMCIWTGQAQTDSLPAHFSQEDIIIDDLFTRKWEVSINGGWSYRVARLSDQVQPDFVNYANQLRSGYNLGADLDFYWRDDMAVGLKYTRFHTKASIDNVVGSHDNTGETIRGSMSDDITVNFIAPSFTYRYIFPSRKAAIQGHYAIGYLAYTNNTTVINEDLKITAQNFGLSLGAQLVVPIGKRTALIAGTTLLGGSFGKFKVQTANSTSETIEVDENSERENVSRIDISAGLRFGL